MNHEINKITVIPPIKIKKFEDINYKKMLEDYERLFCGNKVTFTTNYKLIPSFDVFFEPKQLPHLMGWDKLLHKKIGAGKINTLVKNEKYTVETTRKHHRFNEARKRMKRYNFLHDIFIYEDQKVCVMTRDLKPNPLNLDIVFYRKEENEAIFLGLRRDKRMDYFTPTTLHTKSLDNAYLKRRRTNIKSIEWNPTSTKKTTQNE